MSAGDDLIAQAPACVAAFIEFLAAERLLAGDPAEPLRELCTELAPEFGAACRDRANWGLAKSLGMEMFSDGVDPGDEQALADWMADVNELPREDRDRVIGPAIEKASAGASPPAARKPAVARKAKRKSTKAARKRNRG